MQHQLPPQTPPPAAPSGQLADDVFAVLGVLKRGWVFIVASAAVGLALGLFQVSKFVTSYQSAARLLVLQQGGRVLPGVGGDPLQSLRGGGDALSTHVMIIRSPIIIEEAIAAAGLKGLDPDSVAARLTVAVPDPASKVLQLGYTAGSRAEALRVIAGVIKSYENFLKNNYQKSTSDTIKLFTKARDELNKDLERMEREYLEYRQKNPSYAGGDGGRSFSSRRLEHLEAAANQAMVRSLQLRSQLELGRKLLGEGVEAPAVAAALSRLGSLTGESGPGQGRAEGPAAAVSPRDQLEVQLDDVSVQRMTAARLLDHLKADRDAAKPRAGAGGDEVARAFEAEPATVELRAQAGRARARYNQVRRLSRGGSDPAVVNALRRVKELDDELERLRRGREPMIAAELSRTAGDEIVTAAEAELRALSAREAALRDGVAQVREERLARARAERDGLAGKAAPGDPRVRQLDDLIARLEGKVGAPGPARGAAEAETLIGSIEQDLKAVEAVRARVQEEYDKELPGAKKAEIGLLAESHLKNNLERHRTLFNSVVDQLKQAQLVSDFGSTTAQTLNPPSVSEVRQKRGFTLAAALLLGAGVGAGIAFAADQLDSRIRSLPEMRRALNLRVLGVIPALNREQRATSGVIGLICHSLPRSFISEAYKSVRTNLEFLRRTEDARVVLVTSPQSGDGKSTTASNLAISLAHAGRRVLLVDADMRRPTQHHIHGTDRERGLPHVLKDVLPLRRAVRASQVDNLDLLLAGPQVPNPAELLASSHLVRCLDEMRQAYDVVIIDSPPLMAVADPSILAASVDGIILVVRTTSTCRPDVERSIELLKTSGTPVLGAVVNGITPEQLGVRYGYGNRYGYGYGYGSTYGQDGAEEGDGVGAPPAGRSEIANGSGTH